MSRRSRRILHGHAHGDSKGHTHITRGDDFMCTGGDKDSHAQCAEIAIKFSETLKRKGKTMDTICSQEFVDTLLESTPDS